MFLKDAPRNVLKMSVVEAALCSLHRTGGPDAPPGTRSHQYLTVVVASSSLPYVGGTCSLPGINPSFHFHIVLEDGLWELLKFSP